MSNISDDVIWQVINSQFCAYKLTTPQKESFCRNEYNVNGVCSRMTCPLANSRYATVRSVNGRIYLYMKTAERQHMPSKWWERIKLSRNYAQALAQVEKHLIYWPEHLVDKVKQRLTRLNQVAITERRLALKEHEREYKSTAPKVKRREKTRERKALVAAKIERAIEKELLERLKSGSYGDAPLNVDPKVWNKVLKDVADDEEDKELENEQEAEEESDATDEEVEYVEDDEEDEVVDMEDLEKWLDDASGGEVSAPSSDESDGDGSQDGEHTKKRKSGESHAPHKRPRAGRVEIEYEQEPAVSQAQ